MKLLAFETSSAQLSVALWCDGDVHSREHLDANGGSSNSELSLPTMHALLAEYGVHLKDINAIVFGQGPGAFTGVRIACGVAQGLAFGLGIPTIGLPSTLALAERCATDAVLVALDARMNEIYLAAYARDTDRLLGWYGPVHSKLTTVVKPGTNVLAPFKLPPVTRAPSAVEGVPGKN